MEFIFEILFNLYVELMMHIVPEEKASSPKYRVLTIMIATISMLGNLTLFIWGGILLFERHNIWGLVPIVIALIWALGQILLGCILDKKGNK